MLFASVRFKARPWAKNELPPGAGSVWSDGDVFRSHPPADALAAGGASHLHTQAVIDSKQVDTWLHIITV